MVVMLGDHAERHQLLTADADSDRVHELMIRVHDLTHSLVHTGLSTKQLSVTGFPP